MTREKSCFIKVMGVKNIAFQQTFATFTQSVFTETENVYKSKNKTRCFGKRSRNFNLFENVQIREFFFFLHRRIRGKKISDRIGRPKFMTRRRSG